MADRPKLLVNFLLDGLHLLPIKKFYASFFKSLLNFSKCQQHLAALAQWICLGYHPVALGSIPKHNINAFFNSYLNCDEKRTEINKKRLEFGPYLITIGHFVVPTYLPTYLQLPNATGNLITWSDLDHRLANG